MSQQEQILDYFNIVAKRVRFDLETVKDKTSIKLNYEYELHKYMLECWNKMQEHHLLAVPMLKNICESYLQNVSVDWSSDDAETESSEIAKFGKWFRTELMSLYDTIKVDVENIEEILSSRMQFDLFKDYFNAWSYRNAKGWSTDIERSVKFSDKCYVLNRKTLPHWLSAMEQLPPTDETLVQISIVEDEVSAYFNHFTIAILDRGQMFIVSNEIQWSSLHTKYRTRRPDKHWERRQEYDMPYDIVLEPGKCIESALVQSTLHAHISININDKSWSTLIENLTLAIQENRILDIMHQEPLLLHSEHATKLIGQGAEIETESYIEGAVLQSYVDEIVDMYKEFMPMTKDIALLNVDKLSTVKHWEPGILSTTLKFDNLVRNISREVYYQDVARAIKTNVFNHKNTDLAKYWIKERFNNNWHDIVKKKLFSNKNVFSTFDKIQYENENHFATPDSDWVKRRFKLKGDNRFLCDSTQAKQIREFLFVEAPVNYTTDWTANKSECVCKLCEHNKVDKPRLANTSMYIFIRHWKELMWLFDIEDRNKLPLTLRNFVSSSYNRIYYGNDILNDIDATSKLVNFRHMYNGDHRDRESYVIHFAMCKVCYNRLHKFASDDNLIIDIDYELEKHSGQLESEEAFNEYLSNYDKDLNQHRQKPSKPYRASEHC